MHQIKHLHATVVVAVTVKDVAARRAHQVNGRMLLQIVVHRLELTALKVTDYLLGAPFGLADEHTVGVLLHLFSVQGGGNAAEHHCFAALAIFVGNLKSARQLAGEHHRQRDQIGGFIEIEGLDVFIGKTQFNVVGNRGENTTGPWGGR